MNRGGELVLRLAAAEGLALQTLLDRLDGDGGPGVVVLASRQADPAKYGRIVLGEGDRIARMVEYRDATEEELVEIVTAEKDLRRRAVWLTETGARQLEAALVAWRNAHSLLSKLIDSALARQLAAETEALAARADA